MSIGVPVRLQNGIGNWPDADKFMADYDYLTSLLYGNFSLNGGMELWNGATSFSNPAHGDTVSDSWIVLKTGTLGATVDVSRESTIINSGVYSMKLNITGAGSANSIWDIHQSVLTPSRFGSETVLLGVRVRAATANKVRCKIYDGTNSSYSTYHTGGSTFELLTAQLSVSAIPSELTMTVEVNPSDFTGAVYIDSVFLYVVPSSIGATARTALSYSPLNTSFLALTGGSLSGPLQLPDGSVSAPSLAFAADTNTGLYRIGADNLGITIGGTKRLDFSTTAITAALPLAMGSSKITGLAAGTASGDAIRYEQLVDPTVMASINTTFIGMGRNRIINGEMMIDQISGGAAVTVNAASVVYSVDMWHGLGQGADGVFTLQRSTSTPPTGYSHFLRVTVSTNDASIGASQEYRLGQYMEGYTVRDFNFGGASAKAVTLSFWVRSSLTGTFSGAMKNHNGTRTYVFSYAISSANTWEQKTITIAGDTTGTWNKDNSVSILLTFDLGSGTSIRTTAGSWNASNFVGATSAVSLIGTTSATLDLTGVQLEAGSVATSFEYRPFASEQSLCERYLEKTLPIDTAAAQNSGTQRGTITYRTIIAGASTANSTVWDFRQYKRANPTITYFNPNNTNSNWRNATDGADSGASSGVQSSERGVVAGNAQAAGDGVGETLIVHAMADARLQ